MAKTNKKKINEELGISSVNKFLCRIAGSDLNILCNPKCSHEISRHSRIGAIIISTALMASISMFFAVQTISQSIGIAMPVGLLWGTVIFILDSYIIASYKKLNSKKAEFKLIIPRLVLAFILGCSISIPLELKFFSTEIQDEIVTMKTERQTENQEKAFKEYEMRTQPYVTEREKIESVLKNLRNEILTTSQEIERLNDKKDAEDGGKGITQKPGQGDAYKDIIIQRNYLRDIRLPEITTTNTPLIKLNQQRMNVIDSQIAHIPRPAIETIKLTGLSSQMDALKRLTQRNSYVFFTYWIFFLLILGIETAPIFVKFFSQKGCYDEILSMNEYVVFVEQQKRKSDLHELMNAEIEAIQSINSRKTIAQNAINEKVMELVSNAQKEIAEKSIRLWKLQQLARVDEDVTAFVHSKVS